MYIMICKEHCSVQVWCTKIARILTIVVQTGANLAVFVDKHHVLHVIDLIFFIKWGKGSVTVILHCLPMRLLSSVKDQSKPPKACW